MAAMAMAPAAVSFLALALLMLSDAEAKFLPNNITVVGSVYCDACSNNTFSKHSFFLKGECRCYTISALPLTIVASSCIAFFFLPNNGSFFLQKRCCIAAEHFLGPVCFLRDYII
jgi:hypothetical protein